MTHLGDIIYTLRTNADLSMEALAVKAGVSYSLISKLETQHANPSMRTLERLANALGVRVSWIIEQVERGNK